MNNDLIKGVVAIAALLVIIFVLSYFFLKVVRMILQHRTDRHTAQMEVLLKLAEQGTPIPADLLVMPAAEKVKGDLRRGLVLLCGGLGLTLFLLSLGDHSAWGLGLIPMFTGLGFLLSAKLAQKDKDE
jgi:hypothetical protein